MSLDQFFTPADTCAVAYRSWNPVTEEIAIGDFACGSGSLLEFAPFSKKVVYGLDIDPGVINVLRARHPEWHLCTGDFLYPCRQSDLFLQKLAGTLDMVALNPPFSCRGSTKQYVQFNGKELSCSKALAFVIKSMTFLKESGSLMAILPKSVLRAEKDAEALSHVRREWRIDVKEEFGRRTFPGCYPKTVCVKIQRAKISYGIADAKAKVSSAPKVEIVRGCIPMNSTSETGQHKVLHTTELRVADPIDAIMRYSSRPGRSVMGTFVTLPRVGMPDSRKVRVLQAVDNVSLSDCVFALRPEDALQATRLLCHIQSNWEQLKAMYDSTCAPYITVAQVVSFLSNCGWIASIARDRPVT